MKPEDLLNGWRRRVPPGGALCEDVVSVMQHLGMEVEQRKTGHWTGFHRRLIGSATYPNGAINVNCHAFGKQGVAHPSGIKDIVRATKILEEET